MHEYWNQTYVDYWKEKCALAERTPLDPNLPPSLLVFESIFQTLLPQPRETVLDVGVGFGRMVPSYLKRGLKVTGIDISAEMILQAQSDYPQANFLVAQAQSLPFENASFDLIVCWGAFDTLLDQTGSIAEFKRVSRPGARLLITGKNRRYREDDVEAKLAEEGARKKGHPNNFTDFSQFKQLLHESNLKPRLQFFFLRRGDMAQGMGSFVEPERFYEWALVLQVP